MREPSCRPQEGFFVQEVSMPFRERAKIMEESDVRRAIQRISHEIVERNKGAAALVIVGIRTRGSAPLRAHSRGDIGNRGN